MTDRYGAAYIWTDPHGRGRNRWALFRTMVILGAAPRAARLHLFADTRYRLLVNGLTVGHGPARFFVNAPCYDTHDLTGCLRPGPNAIAVVVNSYGCPTFHSESSSAGLIAWGGIEMPNGITIPLATGPSWKALESPAHVRETACLSFALNPGEVSDARMLPEGWDRPDFDDSSWPSAMPLAEQSNWGPLAPRGIAPLDESVQRPRTRLGAWRVQHAPDETVYSFVNTGPGRTREMRRALAAACTWLYSPCEQTVTLGAWWGDYWVNGTKLTPRPRHDLRLRLDMDAQLRAGWNLMQTCAECGIDAWTGLLGLPRSAGIEVSAERRSGSPGTFLLAGPWYGAQRQLAENLAWPLAAPEDLPSGLGPWRSWSRDHLPCSPHYEHAWSTWQLLDYVPEVAVEGAVYAGQVADGTLALLYDFGGEVLGRPVLDMTAAAGTTVDLFYAERLTPGGWADQYNRYHVELAERYVACDGRQVWHTFHPRGLRYLQVLVSGDVGSFQLHDLRLTRAVYPARDDTYFECSDERLTRVWEMGRDSINACIEDAYLDCPGRERGVYLGDIGVEFFVDMVVNGDTRLMRRCIELYCQVQRPDEPVLPNGVYGPPGWRLDYTAIFAQLLWHYYAYSGDLALLRQAEPHLRTLLAHLRALIVPAVGLVDARDLSPLIEHCAVDKAGINCSANCFVQRAFHDAARVFRAVGEEQEAVGCARTAAELATRIRDAFWDERIRLFRDRRSVDVPASAPSLPGNALAVLYGIAPREHTVHIVDFVADCLSNNHRPDGSVNTSYYFAFYALATLYEHGRAEVAERFIRAAWGAMLDAGAVTCWETVGGGSQCHAWSAAPTYHLSTHVLGVSYPEPGNLHRVRIAPQPGTLTWARGALPHPDGVIEVEWRRMPEGVAVSHSTPATVEVAIPGAPALAPA